MDKLTRVVFIIFLSLCIITCMVASNFIFHLISNITFFDLEKLSLFANWGKGNTTGFDDSIADLVDPGTGTNRVNILVMGLDNSQWRYDEVAHSDTMILISVDPIDRTAAMMSIPRDIWVNISGFGYGRINEAYFNGEAYGLPGGGPELARQTVEEFIGVPVQYYTVIDFNAFIRFIDEIGGITVQPEYPVTVEKMGGANREVLDPGKVYTLDGELALAYIRDRNTPGADVDRAHRQQEAILAIRNRILKYDSLPQLISKAPTLYQEISSGIRTNLDLKQIIQLGIFGLQMDIKDFKKGVIDYDMIIMTTTPGGGEVLEPITEEIRQLRDELFATGTRDPVSQPTGGLNLVKKEAARIAILDGVGDGVLANQTGEFLRSQGFNVVLLDDAGWYLSNTIMEIYNNKPHSIAYLVQLMHVDSSNIYYTYDPSSDLDIRVTIGEDWAIDNPLK